MGWSFFDDVTIGRIPTIVRCRYKIAGSELRLGTSQNPFACWREERVEFRPNQPTGGDRRPISAGLTELRGSAQRWKRFLDIWRYSERMNQVRSIRLKDLTTCTSCSHVGSCTRCPGLAFMEGTMRVAVHAGLRRVLCPHRNSVGLYAGEETGLTRSCADSHNAGQLGSTYRRNCMSSSRQQYSDRKYARNFCAA